MNVLRDGKKLKKICQTLIVSTIILVVNIMKSLTSVTKKVWNTLNMKNIRDYQDLYVQSHVSLLINAFENLLTICLKSSEHVCCCYT